MKKGYLSPSAQIICLAPAEDVARSLFDLNDAWWLNSWGITKQQVMDAGASVTGGVVLDDPEAPATKNYKWD